jgi:hypothetical protein
MGKSFAIVFAFLSQCALACSVEEGPIISELLENEVSVVIITPDQIQGPGAPEGLEQSRKSDVLVQFLDDYLVKASVRIVETLVGPVPNVQKISYYPTYCGGHRFEAGRYYVLAVDSSLEEVKLSLGSNSLLGLGEEYSEEAGARKSNSLLLEALIKYPVSNSLEITPEMLMRYRDITRPDHEWPSSVR